MKGISQIQGIGNIKSVHSIGASSIGKAQRSSYLELYMLRREKDRLEKEIFALDKRTSTSKRQLDSITKRIKKLQNQTHKEQKIKTYRSAPTKPLKTMAINY
jgi:septal ring factor EnvC (AmiA/AmiB activator)